MTHTPTLTFIMIALYVLSLYHVDIIYDAAARNGASAPAVDDDDNDMTMIWQWYDNYGHNDDNDGNDDAYDFAMCRFVDLAIDTTSSRLVVYRVDLLPRSWSWMFIPKHPGDHPHFWLQKDPCFFFEVILGYVWKSYLWYHLIKESHKDSQGSGDCECSTWPSSAWPRRACWRATYRWPRHGAKIQFWTASFTENNEGERWWWLMFDVWCLMMIDVWCLMIDVWCLMFDDDDDVDDDDDDDDVFPNLQKMQTCLDMNPNYPAAVVVFPWNLFRFGGRFDSNQVAHNL